MINFQHNHFELFGLPQRFRLDLARLDEAYRELQSQVHPDRFVRASDAERRVSMQSATLVNEAYRTLKDPLARARYLLSLQRVDVAGESNTAMPAEFLLQQMQWRESVEEAAHQPAALAALAHRLAAEMTDQYAELERRMDGDADYALAAAAVRKLMFLERLREEIGDALERADA
ncbi:MAG: Fe-S protein assembly co-chaperone HscB [Burkholderiales bacterium]